eukprot:1236669-Pyramimonas_sp.AAC.1
MGDPGEGSVFLASELENFAANEVQRCYRGYRVRQRRAASEGKLVLWWVVSAEVEEKALGRGGSGCDSVMLQRLQGAPYV